MSLFLLIPMWRLLYMWYTQSDRERRCIALRKEASYIQDLVATHPTDCCRIEVSTVSLGI
jgi:hypothetical protein